jgi:hypothetical protein
MIGMSIVVFRDDILNVNWGWFFWSNLHSDHLQMTKWCPCSQEGALCLLKPIHKSWNHFSVIFGETLQFEPAVRELHIFYMDLQPPTHAQLKISIWKKNPNIGCLGYDDALECHANTQIHWKSFVHRDQQKQMFRICCPQLVEVTNVKHAFMNWCHCKPIESTLPYLR